jgi:hypothetical protein
MLDMAVLGKKPRGGSSAAVPPLCVWRSAAMALLLSLLCISLLFHSGAAAISSGTKDGMQKWGYVKSRPSNQHLSPSSLISVFAVLEIL